MEDMTVMFKELFVVALMGFPSVVFAADGKLTLTDALQKGIATIPDYGVVTNDRNAAQQQLSQVRALYFPSIDLTGDGGWERVSARTIPDAQTLQRRRASLTLMQPLFDGFGVRNQIDREKYQLESANLRVDEVAQSVGLEIVQAYLEVLRQRRLLSIARANTESHVKLFDTIKAGAEAGTSTEGDVAQAGARLSSARAQVASVDRDLRSAEAQFLQKVGEMPADMEFPDVPRDKISATVEEAVQDALANSPRMAASKSDIKASDAEYKASGATFYPRVTFEVNGTGGSNLSGLEGSQNTASALAVMRWNLFRGGSDNSRQREFMYRLARTRELHAQTARQLERDVRDTWAAMEAAVQHEREFEDQSAENERVVSIYLDQFTLNRRTLLDVLDAQNELFISRSNRADVTYLEMFAVYKLLALKGVLLQSLGVQIPTDLANLEKRAF